MGLLADAARADAFFEGHLYGQCFVFCTLISYLHADFVEDFINKDLGVIGGIWHNWGYFGPPILNYTITFALQHFFLTSHLHESGEGVQGAWRHTGDSVYNVVLERNQVPLTWPAFKFDNECEEHLAVYFAANVLYATFAFYYSTKFIFSAARASQIRVAMKVAGASKKKATKKTVEDLQKKKNN